MSQVSYRTALPRNKNLLGLIYIRGFKPIAKKPSCQFREPPLADVDAIFMFLLCVLRNTPYPIGSTRRVLPTYGLNSMWSRVAIRTPLLGATPVNTMSLFHLALDVSGSSLLLVLVGFLTAHFQFLPPVIYYDSSSICSSSMLVSYKKLLDFALANAYNTT